MLATTDKRLVEDLLQGNESAFERFYDHTFPRLFRFVSARVDHDHHIAEDITQATLCQVMQKLGSFRGEATLFTWICTFARFEISAHFRKRKQLQPESTLIDDTPEIRAALESLAMFAENQDDLIRRQETARWVHVALDNLSPKYGQVLRWKYIEGYSVQHIAQQLGVKVKAAESLLTRSRQAFRDGFTSLAAGLKPSDLGY